MMIQCLYDTTMFVYIIVSSLSNETSKSGLSVLHTERIKETDGFAYIRVGYRTRLQLYLLFSVMFYMDLCARKDIIFKKPRDWY